MKNKKPPLNDYAYEKYTKPVKEREAAKKRNGQKVWWANNWIGLSSLVVALIALAVSVIALLK